MPLILPDSSQLNVAVDRNGTLVASEPIVNFIEGPNIALTVADNPAANRIDVTPAVSVTDHSGAVTASSPASYWHLDETTGTLASDVNAVVNGTYVGSPTLGQASLVSGGGTSVLFSSSSQGVSFGSAAYPFAGAAPFSLECWINLSSTTADASRQGLWGRTFTNANGEQGYRVLVWPDTPSSSTYSVAAARVVNGTGIQASTSGLVTLSLGSRYQIFATYNGTVTKLYVNDALVATSPTDTRSLIAGTANLVFANTSALGGTGQAGLLGLGDEPAVYTREVPLSEIQSHYTAGA